MITCTPILHEGQLQINLVECKDARGLTVRFHFEVIDSKYGKCIGIFDHLLDAESELRKSGLKAS